MLEESAAQDSRKWVEVLEAATQFDDCMGPPDIEPCMSLLEQTGSNDRRVRAAPGIIPGKSTSSRVMTAEGKSDGRNGKGRPRVERNATRHGTD